MAASARGTANAIDRAAPPPKPNPTTADLHGPGFKIFANAAHANVAIRTQAATLASGEGTHSIKGGILRAAGSYARFVTGMWAASYVVLWLLVVVLCVMVVALARQIGTLHLRLGPRGALELDDEGPPLGDAPPSRDARDLDGVPITIGGPGTPQLLLFVSPGCMVCGQVLPSLPVLARTHGLDAVAISEDDEIETRRELSGHNVRIVAGHEHFSAYSVPGTPYAVVLDRLGVVRGKGTVNNLEQFEGLISTARRREQEAVVVSG